MARDQIIRDLKEKLRWLERPQAQAAKVSIRFRGLEPLLRLLPAGGLTAGTIIEWLSNGAGSGAAMLALVLAGRLQQQGGAVIVIDERRDFYPPAARALGVALQRTVVVQPAPGRDALWAWEQSLRSTAVAVTLGWREKLNDRVFRRLQLAAEAGGGLGFLLRPAASRLEPSWAEARLLVEPLPSDQQRSARARRLRLEVLHARGGGDGKTVELELSDETNDVHLVSTLARAARPERSAGA